MRKKSQIKMGATIAVLFIFMILLGFGLTFYARIQRVTITKEIEEQFVLRAIETANIVSFLPELQCSVMGSTKDNCFDLYRIKVFNSSIDESYYWEIVGNSMINITVILPEDKRESFVIYDNPIAGGSRIATNIPVSVYDAVTNQYYIAQLTVNVYK